ncbi:MAG: hypothetical protein JWQ34_174 [Mucilaginibacter sp.]|uniref:family 6 glucosyltransferase n=1 Tax=Mucilaginibacter sp. TaxID=1882438 RepID=UPI00261FCB17|nr:family 6 glucosyltransferase [Mucilaginibacter sp.]MDB5001949.1 hypothetical protein [Mucilaginibacter sp.]
MSSTIGILYICTGNYAIFWEEFYQSSQEFLFKGHKKKYFVFTDAKKIFAEDDSEVKKIYQKTLGWPNNTLLRFEMFLKVEEELKKCDYLFFFNANISFCDHISSEILPNEIDSGLLAVLHPGYWNKKNDEFPYDRNANSKAYIAQGEGDHYFMGGFNGGMRENYLKLINTLKNNIQNDLNKGVIALWHDESHLNHYLLNKMPKILSPEYAYVENWGLPFIPKLIILDKGKYGGHRALRYTGVKKWLLVAKDNVKKMFYYFDIYRRKSI